jgi:MEMO1 family protein
MKRSAAVAGRFYSGNGMQLAKDVEKYSLKDSARQKVIGLLSPHAGLMYSGHVAGALYSSIVFPETFIILCPNHTGLGPDISIMSSGEWEIPSARFSVDEELAGRIMQKLPFFKEDMQAHIHEHSIEVQLPFMAHGAAACKIVPVALGRVSLEQCREAGKGIAEAVSESGRDTVIVASSDMSHYEEDQTARKLDGLAIKEILALNPEGLYSTVIENHITMCGFIPATIMLYAALGLGAKAATLIKYATSGEVSGDYERVVGYAGIAVR